MAGDWIKMRVWISRDPRVIRMANYLAEQREFMNWLTDPVRRTCDTSAYEHVTRNVTVALCVTGLVVTWGTAREQGDRKDDDLHLRHADLNTLDALTEIPKFGEAMHHVGWAIEHDSSTLIFPKFFRDNENPHDKHKRQAAERQARYRKKQSHEDNDNSNVTKSVTRNVTVTHREEKRRDNNTPLPPLSDSELSEPLRKAASDWLDYRGKAFKPRAYKAFTTRIATRAKQFGEQAVIEAMQRAASQGYKGWDFDEWFEKRQTGQPPPGKQFLEVTPEEFKRLRDLDSFKIRPYREVTKDGRVRWSGQKRDGTRVECFIEGATA